MLIERLFSCAANSTTSFKRPPSWLRIDMCGVRVLKSAETARKTQKEARTVDFSAPGKMKAPGRWGKWEPRRIGGLNSNESSLNRRLNLQLLSGHPLQRIIRGANVTVNTLVMTRATIAHRAELLLFLLLLAYSFERRQNLVPLVCERAP